MDYRWCCVRPATRTVTSRLGVVDVCDHLTLSPVIPALIARADNRLVDWLKPVTADAEIVRRKWLFIDIDPVRPSGIGASEPERATARDLASEIEDVLRARGWPYPLVVNSGNGAYLLFKVDLPNDVESTNLITLFYAGLKTLINTSQPVGNLAGIFSQPHSKIDSSVGNAARIARVGGTLNRKGDSVADRPHRPCIVHEPSEECPVDIVPVELIRAVADLAPQPGAKAKTSSHGGSSSNGSHRLMVDAWLRDRGREYSTKSLPDAIAYLLQCPFDPNHGEKGESAIYQRSDGMTTYECKHDSCSGRRWDDARDAIGKPEPHHYDPPLHDRSAKPPKPPKRIVVGDGTIVQAGDRGNYGTVRCDNGATCDVEFVSEEGNHATKELPKSELRLQDGTPLESPAEDDKPRLELISSREFAEAKYSQRYLVSRILVGDQPAIIGGRSKTMKTSLLVELALSLGTGTPFLGEFAATKSVVSLLSGESGKFTIQETAHRIAKAKSVNLSDASVFWGFTLPRLANDVDLVSAEASIIENKIEVLMIDPAYLCLLAGVQQVRSSDVLSMGPLLLRLSELGQRSGCTIILAHHCRKNSPQEMFSVPDLEELSMAGFAEWARQWLLLGRREAYEQGSGMHKLWLNIGGSAGHSGCYAIDIDEGQLADDFTGRKWDVSLSAACDARRDATEAKARKKALELEKREEDHRRRLLQTILRFPEGETAKILREVAGLNAANFGVAAKSLIGEGRMVTCEITKANKKYDGYKPTGI